MKKPLERWQIVGGDVVFGRASQPSGSDHKRVSSVCTGRIFRRAIASRLARTMALKVRPIGSLLVVSCRPYLLLVAAAIETLKSLTRATIVMCFARVGGLRGHC
jgi:hypothetical protein